MPDPAPRRVTPAQLRRWVEAITGERIDKGTMYRPLRRNPWRQALELLVRQRPELIEELNPAMLAIDPSRPPEL
jgi:hypothetical protein